MGRVAFLFSGQGDQFPGMGKNFAETYPESAAVFAACDALRPGTSGTCFAGTAEELRQTAVTQPCLYAVELAQAAALTAAGVRADAAAGFSLGEIAAAAYAGLFDAETGFRLVCRRGALMQEQAEKFDTAMAAVLKLSEEQVRSLCSGYPDLYPVNFNCPGQITVSGLADQMGEFLKAVKTAGGRGVPLKVTGAFHSPFMEEAAAGFAAALRQEQLQTPALPLYSDLTAEPYAGDAAELLSRQICSSVRWEQLIRNMIRDGFDTFVELGPGKTLTNLMKKIDPAVRALTAEQYLEEMHA